MLFHRRSPNRIIILFPPSLTNVPLTLIIRRSEEVTVSMVTSLRVNDE